MIRNDLMKYTQLIGTTTRDGAVEVAVEQDKKCRTSARKNLTGEPQCTYACLVKVT